MYSLLSLISVSVPPLSYLGSGKLRPEIKKHSTCTANSAILAVFVVKHLLKSSPLVHISAFLSQTFCKDYDREEEIIYIHSRYWAINKMSPHTIYAPGGINGKIIYGT